jgi:FixJ family two-component response regulator
VELLRSTYSSIEAAETGMTAEAKHLIVGVDDDIRIRESLMSLVESEGYGSFMFASAEDFLSSGYLDRADCVVTDDEWRE